MNNLIRFAQTLPQLFNQLRGRGYANEDRTLIRDTYELAMILFSAHFQPSGKVYIAHVVGTASILGSLQQPAPVIAAGLLHNAYKNGDFGDAERGLAPAHRGRIRRVIGEEAEQYIARFPSLSWQSRAGQLARNNPQDLDPADRTTLLIRIADLLEHLSDLDLLYYPEEIRRRYLDNCKPAGEIARRLGFTSLAAELEEERRKTEAAMGSIAVPGKRTNSTAFCIVPKSQRKRCAITMRDIWITRRSGLRHRLVRQTKSLQQSIQLLSASVHPWLSRLAGLRLNAPASCLNEVSEEFSSLFYNGGRLERVATGFQFTEGPVWLNEESKLLFSDIPANRIYGLAAGGRITTFRSPSGNSNGLTRDRGGRLVACEQGNRRVTRTETDGSVTVLAETFRGKRLNSPNDVVIKSYGAIYFTDPAYGMGPGEQEQELEGVYRLSPDGCELSLVADDFARPNGLAFSPDERNLYIDDSKRRHLRVFKVEDDGSLSGGAVFHNMNVSARGAPDGMKVDVDGRVFCTGAGGVWVFDTTGKHLGTVVVPEKPSNCAWGDDDGRSLYITAGKSVYTIRATRPGAKLP
jgi:gluconolactonase